MIKFYFLFCILFISKTAFGFSSQTELNDFANNLVVKYSVVQNLGNKQCDANRSGGNCFKAEIKFKLGYDFKAEDFAIYFSHVAPIQKGISEHFNVAHINGDLHKLTAKNTKLNFAQNTWYQISFFADYWHLSEYDAIPNYFIVSGNLKPSLIKSTLAYLDKDSQIEVLPFVTEFGDYQKQFKRSAQDKTQWADAQVIYNQNQALSLDTSSQTNQKVRIIPQVKNLENYQAEMDISTGFKLELGAGVNQKKIEAAVKRIKSFGIQFSDSGIPLSLVLAPNFHSDQAYALHINDGEIEIKAKHNAGIYYGLQTLAGLIDLNQLDQLPKLYIDDEPEYDFRGLHIDIGRNFLGKDLLYKLVDQMGAYKLNKLHLHLADDEGWRLEIDGLPELTELGAYRCFDLSETKCLQPQLGSGPDKASAVNGYLTKQDYISLVKYAAQNHIQVIPSLDMPGHSRAAVKAMELRYKKYHLTEMDKATEFLLTDFDDKTKYSSVQYYQDNTINVCMPSAINFVNKVVDEIALMHQAAGQKLTTYHIGADETAGAWVDSPICQSFATQQGFAANESSQYGSYFIAKVAHLLAEKGIQAAAWSDGLSHVGAEKLPKQIQSNVWSLLSWQGHETAFQHLTNDWQVVLSHPDVTYFDFPYAASPKERGYYWGSRATDSFKVFQFMPENLVMHDQVWLDREGSQYQAKQAILPEKKIAGIQAHLWSETVRSAEIAEYMIFPRVLALAERAWFGADWQPQPKLTDKHKIVSQEFKYQVQQKQDWYGFTQVMTEREFAKLDLHQVNYRLAPPGAQIKAGKLYMNHIFPGTELEYQIKGGLWQVYRVPLQVKQPVQVRAVNPSRTRFSRVLELNH